MSKAVTQSGESPSDVLNDEPDVICQGQGFTLFRSMIITIFIV